MLGLYKNFPENIHKKESLTSILPDQKLQQKLVQTLHEVNRKQFRFEEIGHPAMPDCTVIFEFGIAETMNFTFIDAEETKRILKALKKQPFKIMDFFVAVRYYKGTAPKKTPLRFDYYMLRFIFDEDNSVEVQVFHERGPRYTSPGDIVEFIEKEVNGSSTRKILRKVECLSEI
jgi:hypothetical protein